MGRVVHRVLDEIADDVVELRRIGGKGARLSGNVDGDSLALRLDRRREVRDDSGEDVADVALTGIERLLPRVEPRQPQQIRDEALHPGAVTADDFEKAPRAVGLIRLVL